MQSAQGGYERKGSAWSSATVPLISCTRGPQDLPSWFTLDSERIASLIIGKPDYEMRQATAMQLAPLFKGYTEAAAPAREKFVKRFSDSTEGMTLTALSDITELADRSGLGMGNIDDAVRLMPMAFIRAA